METTLPCISGLGLSSSYDTVEISGSSPSCLLLEIAFVVLLSILSARLHMATETAKAVHDSYE